jgi:hypothetical protein
LKVKYSYKPAEYYGEDDMTDNHTINVLLIEDDETCHVLYVSDPEKLTGYKICPNCHDLSFDVSVKEYNYRYNKHLKTFDGKPISAKVRLDESKPFTPFFNNKTYAYFMA